MPSASARPTVVRGARSASEGDHRVCVVVVCHEALDNTHKTTMSTTPCFHDSRPVHTRLTGMSQCVECVRVDVVGY
jgi:hypothetical protein